MFGLVPFNKGESGIRPSRADDFYSLVDDFFNDSFLSKRYFMNDTFKIDLQENDKEYIVEAELPGVKKEEVCLEMNEGRLNIAVKRYERINEERKNFIHKERRYASMQRSIYLEDAKNEGIKAKLENGILHISIPKQEKTNNTYKINVE